MSVVPSPSKPIPDDTPAHESQFMSASLSDGAVQVTHALLSLAPSVCLAEDAVGNVRETFSARQAVYANASLSNKEMFQDLPPVLMHADPRANANKLYGGSRPSPVPHAAYQPGVWGGAPWNERIYFGVALFDLNGESHLAALYTVESTLVCHVYGAPLAELESQLFDVRRPVSLIEKAWLGEPLGNTLRDLRVATGAYLRSQGFGTFPGFLLTGDHHLVRPGVLPLLHLRGYKTDLERERVEQMLFSLLAIQGTADGSAPRCELGETFINVSNVITVFDSCGVPEKDLALPDGADQHIYKMLEVSRCRLMYLVAGYIVQPWNDKLDEATANAAEVMHANVLTVELAQVSEMARAEKHMTLSSITRVVGMCCATGVELIVSIGSMAELVERVSTRLFELSDVVLATRDLVTTVEKEPRSWAHDAFVAIENMARRVASPQVVLIIETDSCHVVGKMKVVNCDTLTEITTVETATRLLFCPWVSALIMHTGADANRSVYTINTRTVERDQLRVTEAIRKAHTAAPSKHSRPIASPGDVDQLRRDINTRLDTMKTRDSIADLSRAEIATTQMGKGNGTDLLLEHDHGARVGTIHASWEGRNGELRVLGVVNNPEVESAVRKGTLRGLSLGTGVVSDTRGNAIMRTQDELSLCEEPRRGGCFVDSIDGASVRAVACFSQKSNRKCSPLTHPYHKTHTSTYHQTEPS